MPAQHADPDTADSDNDDDDDDAAPNAMWSREYKASTRRLLVDNDNDNDNANDTASPPQRAQPSCK
jgi:hypothetical protein